VQELSESWVAEIRRRGHDVVGELSDLIGAPPASDYADPDRPSERQVADAAVDAIKALLLENARVRREEERLHAELQEAHLALERSYLRPTYRLREKVVRRLEHSMAGKGLLKVYRAARGRSSLSA